MLARCAVAVHAILILMLVTSNMNAIRSATMRFLSVYISAHKVLKRDIPSS